MNTTQPEDIRGTIHLTLNYDLNAGILTVRLIEVGLNTLTKINQIAASITIIIGTRLAT